MLDFINRQQLKRIIAFDRICRLADIGEKDLSFRIITAYSAKVFGPKYTGPVKVFRLNFFYSDPRVLNSNPKSYVGEIWEVDNIHDTSAVEEDVALKIRQIKANPNHRA